MTAMTIAIVLLVLGLLLAVLVWHFRSSQRPLPRPTDPPGMRSHVSFVGGERYVSKGDVTPGAELTRASCAILEQVAAGLRERGITPGEIVLEAWGALLEVGHGSDQLRVCGGQRGDDWLLYATHGSGGIVDTPQARALLAAIDATLKHLPGIENVRWHRAEDWAVGREDQGVAEPLPR
jgi:hypothetical protein